MSEVSVFNEMCAFINNHVTFHTIVRGTIKIV